MSHRNRGSISAFVVCSLMGLTALTGLVFDGGRVVSKYADLSDLAENAARVGCQQIMGIRSGSPHIDSTNASRQISQFLNAHGLHGQISVSDGASTVTLKEVVQMRLLVLIGIRNKTISVTRSAHVVSG
ncbi:MAG: pilus assembly protein TadG-related protein [Actinomycetes bacterium]|jgi:hypothetical protein